MRRATGVQVQRAVADARRRAGVRAWLALAALGLMLAPVWAEEQPAVKGSAAAPAQAVVLSADTRAQYWFGVAVENIPPSMAKQLKLKPDQGVMVGAVFAGSPAEKAGLQPDDLLIELNGVPLTSQEELARAANTTGTAKIGATKSPPPLMQVSTIVYLREGDRHETRLTPELRPVELLVSGANVQAFTPNGGGPAAVPGGAVGAAPVVRNIVLSNGVTAKVGPGYPVDPRSQANFNMLRQAAPDGQTLILTQETDSSGNVKNTIKDGKATYVVEAGKLDQIPANYRPLAEQMLAPAPTATAVARPEPADGGSTDERLQRLEQQNEDLKKQLEELKGLLLKATQK